MASEVVRCPDCGQTVVAEHGVIKVHKRNQNAKLVQCSGSGRSV